MDLIDREQAIEWINNWRDVNKYYHPLSKNKTIPISKVIDILESVPSTEKTGKWAWPSAAKTAEWIESTESCMRPFMCSNCGCIYDVDTFMGEPVWNHCPHCGARMVNDNE